MGTFDEQTDFSFLSLQEPAPVAVTPKKSRSVQIGQSTVTIRWTHSDEFKAKMSKTHKGKSKSEEQKAKASASLKLQKATPEAKAAMSKARKGKKMPESAKAKLSALALGRKLSEEQKARYRKPMMTPAGVLSSRNEALAFFGINPDTMARWLRQHPQHFYYITKD